MEVHIRLKCLIFPHSFQQPKTPVGILRKVSTWNSQGGDELGQGGGQDAPRRRTGSTPKSVKIDESSLQQTSPRGDLEAHIAECLRKENIDLTKPPYSSDVSRISLI